MILDFPTKEDFFKTSENYLNSSWDLVVKLLLEFDSILESIEDSPDANDINQYWDAAKQTLITAAALAQQAVEFYIKGEIVHVSPYILISGSPQSWPKGCSKKDISFSSFRSLDAQDLIKVHDTVCSNRFPDEFIQRYNESRIIRNKMMHTVDRNLTVKLEEVIESILYVFNYFSENKNWFKSRKQYFSNNPFCSIRFFKEDKDSESYIVYDLLREFKVIVNILSPSLSLKYLNFDKKATSLLCPNCYQIISESEFFDDRLMDDIRNTYQKKDNIDVYECCICNYSGETLNQKCENEYCDSEKLDAHSGLCLSCGSENSL